MRNLTHRWPQSWHFCPKLGHFFLIFEKGQGRPPPSPPAPVLAIENEEFFFTIAFSFKLKKYQHNTGTPACNLCSNFPGTYLQSFPIKQSNPPLHPQFWLKLSKQYRKNHVFQCFARCFALLIFHPCWFPRKLSNHEFDKVQWCALNLGIYVRYTIDRLE